ncbi:hypothetical protein [Mycobacterium sherrisii]|nr:hypothetical protein [Mycobacterium sherrisii]MEC4765433.1 hypothetical protein [Mycobacterium sherrisii]
MRDYWMFGGKSHDPRVEARTDKCGDAGLRIDSMTSSSDLVAVDLTEREREFIQQALEQWALSAADAPFPFQILGSSTWDEFSDLTVRLKRAVTNGAPLTDLDWARALFLTEITWASDLVGAGLDFATVTGFSDTEAVSLLRGLQRRRKIGGRTRAKLLFPNGGRTRTASEIEEEKQWAENVRREQEGRHYPPGL